MSLIRGILLGLIFSLLLHACTSPRPLSPERRLQIACSSYVDAVNALATRNRLGLLSGKAQARVDSAVDIIGPVCEGKVDADADSVLEAVETALIVMLEAKAEADGG
ncbi:MAG: hypothetical protein OEU92_09385 [Alphaproteobacteria bacterium]|nr:hypothetical protein [Alphaproteobacteria bacterium]